MQKTKSRAAYIVGIGASSIGRYPERSFTDLVRDAYTAACSDSGLTDPDRIQATWFSSLLMDYFGPRAMRGQVTLLPLMDDGVFPSACPIVNVEGGCASGSVAFNSAWSAIQNGADLTLAIGVEKMNDATRPATDLLQFMDAKVPDYYWDAFARLAKELDVNFDLGPGRSLGMDLYAVLALSHMREYGTTVEQMATAAAKNHTAAVDNPRAQYRFPMTPSAVLNDRVVVDPLTRAMCAPRGDGAAAVLVCSERYLAEQQVEVRERALLVRGHAVAGGRFNAAGWEDSRSPVRSAAMSYEMAGLGPTDLDLIELHDATSFAEIHLVEDLGLCARGSGGPFTASGATGKDGPTPVNPSGGLISRGHPIGATGIIMLNELALQLRGEAGKIQIPDACIGMAENGGGMIGLDNALCSTTILERRA